MGVYMNTQDAPLANLGTFFTTINGRRYEMLNVRNVEATASVNTEEIHRAGARVLGHKVSGEVTLKLSFTVYKCSEMFDKLVEEYIKTGVMPTFDCQIDSDDPATSIGMSSKTYTGCVLDGDILLSKLDAEGGFIEQELTAYASDMIVGSEYDDTNVF